MARGRPPKPTKVLELTGAFRKNSARRRARAGEVKVTEGIGEPPMEWVDGSPKNGRCQELLSIWNEVVEINGEILNRGDRLVIEQICEVIYKSRRASRGFGKVTISDRNFVRSVMNELARRRTYGNTERPKSADRPGSQWGELVG